MRRWKIETRGGLFMGGVYAVFRKEYLETRSATLVFLIVGVLFLFLLLLDDDEFGFIAEDPSAIGGIFAVWLNAVLLTATTFAREREIGTFQTLRRIAPDWRVAAAGKFGWILASTLALAAFFAVESFVVAKIAGQRPFAAFEGDVNSFVARSIALSAAVVGWGVFWTGRASSQMSPSFARYSVRS